MSELKDCPFCWEDGVSAQNIVLQTLEGVNYIRCEWCGSAWWILKSLDRRDPKNPKGRNPITKSDLIKLYNNRPIEDALQTELATRKKDQIALDAEVIALTAQLTDLEDSLKWRDATIADNRTKLTAAQAEIERLKGYILYAWHKNSCASLGGKDCDCGFTALK